jgi:hypothetical protein
MQPGGSRQPAKRLLVGLCLTLFLAGCASPLPPPAPGPILTPMLENPTLAPTAASAPLPTGTAAPLPTLAGAATAARPSGPVSFYRLRVELSTTSDWTSLDFPTPDAILAARLISTSGVTRVARVTPGELYLSQDQAAARTGTSVGLVADLALAAPLTSHQLPLVIKRGGIPATSLRISAVQGQSLLPLLQTVHKTNIPADKAANALPVSMNLAPLASDTPLSAAGARPDVPRMLWAFYYQWYHGLDWNKAELRDHPTQTYDSADPQTIASQIDQAKSAGIDGFIASWWGPGDQTDKNLKTLLDVARQKNFKVFIYFETLQATGPLSADDIYKWLAYAIPTYRDAPAYMKWDGKPVIAFYNSGLVPLTTWKDVFARLHAQGLDVAALAMGLDAANLDVFDGYHTYADVAISDLPQAFAQASRAAYFYPLLAGQPSSPAPRLWAATIQPGYDERLIPGRAGLVVDRQNGDYYRATFQAAEASSPDWIFITTWNEWWENSYIEPGQAYGDQYLKLTRAFADQWKKQG